MSQLEVVKFRDVLRIVDIPRFVPDRGEPTLEVFGEDFTSIQKIYLNDVQATSWIVVNKTTLWVVVPEGISSALKTLEIISSDFTKTGQASKVSFEIGESPKRVTGILSLLQLFTKWMLQDPGSDILNPGRGGGVQSLIGRLVDLHKMDRILSSLTRAINDTAEQIRTAQSQFPGIPLDERLLDAVLLDVNIIEESMEIMARVLVTSAAGDEAVNALVL